MSEGKRSNAVDRLLRESSAPGPELVTDKAEPGKLVDELVNELVNALRSEQVLP
jgi:hypothetical protein